MSFENTALHDMCVDLDRAEQMFGSITASALVNFISDAISFENVGELIEFLTGDVEIRMDDSLFIALGSDYRAYLVVVGTQFRRDAQGRIVWDTVTRLKLVQISRLP